MKICKGVFLGLLSILLVYNVNAIPPPGHRLHRKTLSLSTLTPKVDPRYGPYYFEQPIDHQDTESTTTFKQRYWVNSDWYKSGGPVILYNAGETAADERSQFVTNSSMAQLAQSLDGIVIVLEHRSYGQSQPGADYSTKYLKTLTTYNALEDMANIIRNIKIPNLDQDIPPAPKTKWIVYGGSYSGNLAAWMRHKYPDIVFAAVPSSAPVQTSYNFYQYFQAVQKYAPSHCVRSIETVINYVDHILFSPFHKPKDQLKKQFGAEGLQHDDDFAECKYKGYINYMD
ncbi:serine carboxypeptidase S28-domain-containing protein [Chlamydoabsidia padenii]|nr:serine carboxypeptidase S28-domain-containing protein [Chlamydoabsidia padenii]